MITTESENDKALKRAEFLMDEMNKMSDELDSLTNEIVAYEDIHYPMGKSDETN